MYKKNFQRLLNESIDTIQIFDSLKKELDRIIDAIDFLNKRLKNENEFLREVQPWFRIAIRSTISMIEASCYKLKQFTILICDYRKKPLSPTDREKLIEKKQDENGKLRNYYLETKENIKFALKKIHYAYDLPFKINNHEGWQKLLNTIDIRNKLTHPKKKVDLDVSPQQYEDAIEGFGWFTKKIDELESKIPAKWKPRA